VEKIKSYIASIFNDIRSAGQIPVEWNTAQVINICNKGNRNVCSNYRSTCISLMTMAYKLYAVILKAKLQPTAEEILTEEQCGFHKGSSCTDSVFMLKHMMLKRREFNLPLYLILSDYGQAYDKVDHNKIWQVLDSYEIPTNLVDAVKSLYKDTNISVMTNQNKSTHKPFYVNRGL
jgi:hypothetical protein